MLKNIINEYLVAKKIPGGVIHVQQGNVVLFRDSFGTFVTNTGEEKEITMQTLFDIASLTKIVATLPATLVLLEKERLSLDDSVQKYIPHFQYPNIKIEHLLYHNSGLPADLTPPVKRGENRDILEEILSVNPIFEPGKTVVYSDLGMILLGKIIEKVSGETFDKFVEREVLIPMGLKNTTFNPKEEVRSLIASTEYMNGSYVQGVVHDEKAYMLNGVSGSAGLFSSLDDLVQYVHYWLHPSDQTVFNPTLLQDCHQTFFKYRGLGFEVWNGKDTEVTISTSWSNGSFGHTGFTGTSIWIDPKEKLFVVLLTNAIHFGRDAPKKEFRLNIHESVYEMFIKKESNNYEKLD